MIEHRRFEVEELTLRPGTYFNPDTEVLIVVDDSPELDHEIFEAEDDLDDAEWVLISDEVPVDEHRRDELLERYRVTYRAANAQALAAEHDAEEGEDKDDELEPDEPEAAHE